MILPALGAKVIAAASTQEKLDVSVKFGGADYVVDYTKKDWQKEVMKITGGKGADVIYDPVGMIRGKYTHTPQTYLDMGLTCG
jgi:NADPH:quinone reductase